ncbi:SUKH-4 family immunity protein [Streptomyces sp. NPDC059575]|uniref:SUKH-4 family immunity protein n=1 Tax=Streptomyces sp. NPDC059575 TaxID=3346872 RepID=UPI003689F387
MLFTVDHDTLTQTTLVDEVRRLPEPTARAYGFHGGTLDFLVRTGLPSADVYDLWFGLPDAFDPGYVWAYAEQADQGWVHPDRAETVVKLGGFLTNSVAVDPRTGVVYQYTEGTKRVIPLHGDVSSLAHTTIAFLGHVDSLAEHADARRRREVEALVTRIRHVDPLPFRHEHSTWIELFDNLECGLYT